MATQLKDEVECGSQCSDSCVGGCAWSTSYGDSILPCSCVQLPFQASHPIPDLRTLGLAMAPARLAEPET